MNDTLIFMTDQDRRGSAPRRGLQPDLLDHLADEGAAGLQSRRPAGQSAPASYSASYSAPYSASYHPQSQSRDQAPAAPPTVPAKRRRPPKPPASNAYVRYLLDSQLFNVPGNHEKFRMLLSYLHAERIFDVTYVVAVQTSKLRDNADHRWWTPADQREKLAQRNRRRGGGGGNGNLEDEKCTNLFNEACSTQIGAGHAARNLDREMFSTRRQTAVGAGVLHPIDAYDVRDFLQNVKLTGDEDEWLDLKIQLCLPSVLFFVKLKGSATRVPNADYTVLVDMKQLQMLQTTETIGEKLARILASVRKRFLNADTPDFDRLQLWSEMDEEVEEEAGDGTPARYHPGSNDDGGGPTQALVPSSQTLALPNQQPFPYQPTTNHETSSLQLATYQQPPPNSYAPTNYEDPPLFWPATQTESQEDQEEKKRKREQYRRMYSSGNIMSVYKIAEG